MKRLTISSLILIAVLCSVTITTVLADTVTINTYPYQIPGSSNSGFNVGSSGFVGIGTSNPLTPLHLVTSGATEQRVEGGAGAYYTLKDNSGPLNSKFIRIADGSGNMYIQTVNDAYTSATNLVTIQNNGFVGIGTTSPQQALDVSGNLRLTGNVVSPNDICIGTC